MAIKLIPPDPVGMNDRRAERAGSVLRMFVGMTRSSEPLRDLLTDLAHWADRNGKDFSLEMGVAAASYKSETEGP